MKKVDYKVITHHDRETFDKIVSDFLNEGYQLHGSAQLSRHSGSSYNYFTQAIVKYPKKQEQ